MGRDYTNRELDRMFKELQDEMESHFLTQKDQLNRIESQTMRTNGRVSSLERWRTGIIMSLGLIAFIVIPLLVYSFNAAQQAQSAEILSQIKK